MAQAIIYQTENNGVAVIYLTATTKTVEQVVNEQVPLATSYQIVQTETLPSDILCDAWVYGESVTINIPSAKNIAHKYRRIARLKEFAPYDDIIAKQIPGEIEDAEAQRALIRTKYATKQTEIDACTTVDELQAIIDKMRGDV